MTPSFPDHLQVLPHLGCSNHSRKPEALGLLDIPRIPREGHLVLGTFAVGGGGGPNKRFGLHTRHLLVPSICWVPCSRSGVTAKKGVDPS